MRSDVHSRSQVRTEQNDQTWMALAGAMLLSWQEHAHSAAAATLAMAQNAPHADSASVHALALPSDRAETGALLESPLRLAGTEGNVLQIAGSGEASGTQQSVLQSTQHGAESAVGALNGKYFDALTALSGQAQLVQGGQDSTGQTLGKSALHTAVPLFFEIQPPSYDQVESIASPTLSAVLGEQSASVREELRAVAAQPVDEVRETYLTARDTYLIAHDESVQNWHAAYANPALDELRPSTNQLAYSINSTGVPSQGLDLYYRSGANADRFMTTHF